ncbi:MAG: hypothetical protein QOJ03_374, partial [Frankiaceae bacterium]|nr:hypothetical protein [Frankiaceae bacterium]
MRRWRWLGAALPLAVAATVLTPATAHATGVVDLVTFMSANEGSGPVAVGADTDFYVNVQNVGDFDTTSQPVTVGLSAVNGTITGVGDNFSDVGFNCASTASCTTSAGLVGSQDVLRMVVTVHVGTASPLTVTADADSSPDTDANSGDNSATSDPVTVQQPPAVQLTHTLVYDPDDVFGGGTTHTSGPINPANTFMDLRLTEVASPHNPVASEFLQVTCRRDGTADAFVALNTIPYGNDYTDDNGVLRFNMDLDPTAYECHLLHPGTLNGTALDQLVTLQPRHTNMATTFNTKSLSYGRTMSIGVALTFDSGKPVGYANAAPVQLQRRPLGSTGGWTVVKTAEADYATGKATVAIKPTGSAEYRVRFPGVYFGAGPAYSSPAAITVRQGVTTVLDPIVVPPGGVSMLTARVRPAQGGAPVTLQHRTANGWANNTRKTLTAASTQTWRFKPRKQGVVDYRVFRGARGTIVGGGSAPVTLTVTLKGKGSAKSHAYAESYHGHPWSWNPCATIHYRVNVKNAPSRGLADVKESLRRIHLVNGLKFRYDGTTHAVPDPFQGQAEDLLVAWVSKSPYLQGAAGLGGANEARPRGDHMLYRSGFALLDAGLKLRPGFGRGITEGQLLMHELGHAVGLG